MNLPAVAEKFDEDYEDGLKHVGELGTCDFISAPPGENATTTDEIMEKPSPNLISNSDTKEVFVLDREDILNAIPKPLDGGYGWVIVFASFFLSILYDSLTPIYSIFLDSLTVYFNTTKTNASAVESLLGGISWFSGPLASALVNMYGFRFAAMAGSVLCACGLLFGAFSPNIGILIFTHGILGGVGNSLMRFGAVLSVGYYFSTRRPLAFGICMFGSGFGTFVLAPIVHTMINSYGWQGATVLFAGVMLNGAVFGTFLRPLTVDFKEHGEQQFEQTAEIKSKASTSVIVNVMSDVVQEKLPQVSITDNSIAVTEFQRTENDLNSDRKFKLDARKFMKETDRKCFPFATQDRKLSYVIDVDEEVISTVQDKVRNGRLSICLDSLPRKSIIATNASSVIEFTTPRKNTMIKPPSISGQRESVRRMTINHMDLSRPLYRKDIFYRNSIAKLPQYRSLIVNSNSYLSSVTTVPLREDSIIKKPTSLFGFLKLPTSMTDVFEELLDIAILKNVLYLCLCISNIPSLAAYIIPFIYFSNRAVQRGVDSEMASILISVIGISSAVGRLLFNSITDFPQLPATYVHNISMLISGIFTLVMPFTTSYTAMVFAAIGYGLFSGGFVATTSLALVDILGLDKLTSAFGIIGIFRGVGLVIGPLVSAFIASATGNVSSPFYLGGGLYILSSVILFAGSRYQRKQD